MRQWLKRREDRSLRRATALAAVLFVVLCLQRVLVSYAASVNGLFESKPLSENKDIYQLDTNLYDVYISVFPTEDENGNMLDFSAFKLHTALDHSYNPTLNCNIQILPEGQVPDDSFHLDKENATIRVRGNSSRGAKYKSYRVRLKQRADAFFGQTVLNLNKDFFDVTKVSTKLSADLLAGMDNAASYRTYFMRLWIRDASLPQEEQEFEYQGMYIELEQPNKDYLAVRGLSSNGASLYKARNFVFRRDDALLDVDDPEYSEDAFEQVLGIREGSSHKKLLEMLDAVNDTSRDFEEVFAEYFNEDNYLTWLAFNVLLGHDDIINQNYMLYSPRGSQTWYFICWDLDSGLRFEDFETDRPISLRGIQRLSVSTLHNRYFKMPGSLDKLDAKMRELLDTCITRERVTELVEAYKPVLEKTITQRPDLTYLRKGLDYARSYFDSLYDCILHNYDVFKASSQYPLSGYIAMPVRNEDGSVRFAWDSFFSLKGLPVSYSLQIYTDYDKQNLVYEATDCQETHYLLEEGLPNGTYYAMITGTDSDGREQISQERVSVVDGRKTYTKYGLLEFTLE